MTAAGTGGLAVAAWRSAGCVTHAAGEAESLCLWMEMECQRERVTWGLWAGALARHRCHSMISLRRVCVVWVWREDQELGFAPVKFNTSLGHPGVDVVSGTKVWISGAKSRLGV